MIVGMDDGEYLHHTDGICEACRPLAVKKPIAPVLLEMANASAISVMRSEFSGYTQDNLVMLHDIYRNRSKAISIELSTRCRLEDSTSD